MVPMTLWWTAELLHCSGAVPSPQTPTEEEAGEEEAAEWWYHTGVSLVLVHPGLHTGGAIILAVSWDALATLLPNRPTMPQPIGDHL